MKFLLAHRAMRLLALLILLVVTSQAAPQGQRRAGEAARKETPKQVPVAETRLLMEGLNQANFRGLERHLKEKPADAETWTFVRGQSLLIAETGNLLMLRPPRSRGGDVWMERSAELRFTGTRLARAAANRDYELCRTVFTDLANTCNRCHQTFRVPVRMTPFAPPGERKTAETE